VTRRRRHPREPEMKTPSPSAPIARPASQAQREAGAVLFQIHDRAPPTLVLCPQFAVQFPSRNRLKSRGRLGLLIVRPHPRKANTFVAYQKPAERDGRITTLMSPSVQVFGRRHDEATRAAAAGVRKAHARIRGSWAPDKQRALLDLCRRRLCRIPAVA